MKSHRKAAEGDTSAPDTKAMPKKAVSLSLGKAAALVPAVVTPGVASAETTDFGDFGDFASDSGGVDDFGDFGDLAGAGAVAGASDDFGELVMVPDIVVSTTASTKSEVSAVQEQFVTVPDTVVSTIGSKKTEVCALGLEMSRIKTMPMLCLSRVKSWLINPVLKPSVMLVQHGYEAYVPHTHIVICVGTILGSCGIACPTSCAILQSVQHLSLRKLVTFMICHTFRFVLHLKKRM